MDTVTVTIRNTKLDPATGATVLAADSTPEVVVTTETISVNRLDYIWQREDGKCFARYRVPPQSVALNEITADDYAALLAQGVLTLAAYAQQQEPA